MCVLPLALCLGRCLCTENQRVGPAKDYDQARMGTPHLTVIFRGASSGRRGRPTARLARVAFARHMFILLI
jgi:hypothetical protein